jgi:hypothetical protein
VRSRRHILAFATNSQRPHFTMMTLELLNALKLFPRSLSIKEDVEIVFKTDLVAIPILEHLVLAHSPKVVRVLLERDLHDAVLVGKQRAVAIPEIEPPDLDVLVRRTRYDQLRVARYVER